MAGEREASVKLTLDSGEYMVELRKVGDANTKLGVQGKKSMGAIGRGVDAVKKDFIGLKNSIGKAAKMALTFGGAFSFGAAVKGAINLRSELLVLQNELQGAGQGTISLTALQDKFEKKAGDTARTTSEMMSSFQLIRGVTQDMKFANATIEATGVAANATGESVESMAKIVGELNKRFGITAQEAPEALAKVISASRRGAFSLDEVGQVMERLGPTMKEAGLGGARGLNIMLGMFEDVDNKLGNTGQKLTGIQNLMLNLGQRGRQLNVAKAAGIKADDLINEKDSIAKLRRVLEAGEKGMKALGKNFVGPEERKAMSLLLDPFKQAQARAKAAGGTERAGIEAGLKAFDAQIKGFATAGGGFKELKKQSDKVAEGDPASKMRVALDNIQKAFNQPKMIAAIQKIADKLPAMADAIADMISFILDNPLLSGGLAVGAKVASTAVPAALFGGGGIGSLLGGGRGLLGGRPQGLVGPASTPSQARLANKIVGGFKLGAGSMGQAMGQAAGPIMGALMAAVVAKAFIDAALEEQVAEQNREVTSTVGATQAAFSGDESRIKAALKERQAARDSAIAEKADANTFTSRLKRGFDRSLGLTESGKSFDTSSRSLGDVARDTKLTDANEDIARLTAALEKLANKPAEDAVAQEVKKQTGPQTVRIDPADTRTMAAQMASGISDKTLRVRVENMPVAGFDTSGSGGRGPLEPGAPQAGGGTGGI